jgi:hypothetical protein
LLAASTWPAACGTRPPASVYDRPDGCGTSPVGIGRLDVDGRVSVRAVSAVRDGCDALHHEVCRASIRSQSAIGSRSSSRAGPGARAPSAGGRAVEVNIGRLRFSISDDLAADAGQADGIDRRRGHRHRAVAAPSRVGAASRARRPARGYDVRLTTRPWRRRFAHAAADAARRWCFVGGDGRSTRSSTGCSTTMAQARHAGEGLPLGLVPAGRGSDYARGRIPVTRPLADRCPASRATSAAPWTSADDLPRRPWWPGGRPGATDRRCRGPDEAGVPDPSGSPVLHQRRGVGFSPRRPAHGTLPAAPWRTSYGGVAADYGRLARPQPSPALGRGRREETRSVSRSSSPSVATKVWHARAPDATDRRPLRCRAHRRHVTLELVTFAWRIRSGDHPLATGHHAPHGNLSVEVADAGDRHLQADGGSSAGTRSPSASCRRAPVRLVASGRGQLRPPAARSAGRTQLTSAISGSIRVAGTSAPASGT